MSKKFKQYLVEGKAKMKPKLHKLDNTIEKFIEDIEKQIDDIEDNPVFQRKINQLLVDMSKEHSEFIMALRAIVAALDRGAQVIPLVKPEAIAKGVKQDLEQFQPNEDEEEIEVDSDDVIGKVKDEIK